MYVGQPKPAPDECIAIVHASTDTAISQDIGNEHHGALHVFTHTNPCRLLTQHTTHLAIASLQCTAVHMTDSDWTVAL